MLAALLSLLQDSTLGRGGVEQGKVGLVVLPCLVQGLLSCGMFMHLINFPFSSQFTHSSFLRIGQLSNVDLDDDAHELVSGTKRNEQLL